MKLNHGPPLLLLATAAGVVCSGAVGSLPATAADRIASGLFGLTRTEVARVNVSHIGDPNLTPCTFEIVARDASGGAVKRTLQTLPPGASYRFDVTATDLAPVPADDARGSRKRLQLEIKGFNPQPDPPGCVATRELYDASSGVTRVFLGGPDTIPAGP
jgi:hypothetical protein